MSDWQEELKTAREETRRLKMVAVKTLAQQAKAISADVVCQLFVDRIGVDEIGGELVTHDTGIPVVGKLHLMRQDPEYRHLFRHQRENLTEKGEKSFEASANPRSPNPWLSGNLTEQGRLIQTHPNLARQSIIAAGLNPETYGL